MNFEYGKKIADYQKDVENLRQYIKMRSELEKQKYNQQQILKKSEL